MAVLDSSAIIHVLSGTKTGEQLKTQFGEEAISTTAISLNEVFIGLRTDAERKTAVEFFKELEVLAFDETAAFKSIEIENSLKKNGKLIGKLDMMIAAICIVHGLPLLTTDNDFKNVSSLKVLRLN
ncbi:MAG: PIN domain-containing protein [Candidatus Aenigmarchaeota archaeon]|nr:PIN domain-containing protein [Candidatus Aenigmarchaeota archaeon]